MAKNHKIDALAVLARIQEEGPDARLRRGEAVAILDALLAGAASYERRKKLGNQLDAALRDRDRPGRIPPIKKMPAGFTVDDVAHWATRLYREPLEALPRRPRAEVNVDSFQEIGVVCDSAELISYPGTVERCHVEIRRMSEKIRLLERELALKDRLLAGKEREFKYRQAARFKKK